MFALLPRLLERSGQSAAGAITAIYTILVEGGDMDEPIADEVRGILDGHVILERSLAARGHFPAIDVGVSLSRVMDAVVSHEHADASRKLRESQAIYEEKRDLVALGGYAKGSDARVDHALRVQPQIERFLRQPASETSRFEDTVATLRKSRRREGQQGILMRFSDHRTRRFEPDALRAALSPALRAVSWRAC